MALLPSSVSSEEWSDPLSQFFTLINQGKVRDTYKCLGNLLQVVSRRVSIFNFVLPAQIPGKDEILTAMTIFWFTKILNEIPHHLRIFGESELRRLLPEHLVTELGLWKRAVVVKPLRMVPTECIVRAFLTGTGWNAYKDTREVCGHKLPEGLFDGARLPTPIFAPTTKAAIGDDEHVHADSVDKDLKDPTLLAFDLASQYARTRGILIADTKLEWGRTVQKPSGVSRLILGDEVFTPDSSRFWDEKEWEEAAQRKSPPPAYDKQFLREWGKKVETPWGKGIDKLKGDNPEHVQFVHGLTVPSDVIEETAKRYHTIFERLVGSTLKDFQNAVMR